LTVGQGTLGQCHDSPTVDRNAGIRDLRELFLELSYEEGNLEVVEYRISIGVDEAKTS
jgi:hypothetical protein